MWMSRRQLERDLARWSDQGWVTADGRREIGRELSQTRRGPGLAGALGVLGVVLLGFAAMSFVAANWQEMPRLARLAIIFGGLVGAYAGAAFLLARGMDAFAHAAILLGVAVFGAGIMLIAQMYHIEGHPPGAVLVWALGGLGAGVVLRSNPALAAATILFAIWSVWEMTLSGSVHWPLLLAAAALAGAFLLQRWWPGAHLVGLLVSGWTVLLGHLLDGGNRHEIVLLIGLAVAVAAGLLIRRPVRRGGSDSLGVMILGYGMTTAFSGLFAMQFIEKTGASTLILLAAVTIALLIGAIYLGLSTGERAIAWLGYTGFSIEILAIYFKTVGTLLGSSLFFLVAGLIVMALAAFAWRLHRSAAEPHGVLS